MWHISTLQESPGFTAQVHTGDSVEPVAVQMQDLAGFTGSYWDVTVGQAKADVKGGTFVIKGTAEGYYLANSSERATAEFEIRTDC